MTTDGEPCEIFLWCVRPKGHAGPFGPERRLGAPHKGPASWYYPAQSGEDWDEETGTFNWTFEVSPEVARWNAEAEAAVIKRMGWTEEQAAAKRHPVTIAQATAIEAARRQTPEARARAAELLAAWISTGRAEHALWMQEHPDLAPAIDEEHIARQAPKAGPAS